MRTFPVTASSSCVRSDITPDIITGYQRIGYRNLPVDTLVAAQGARHHAGVRRSVVQAGRQMPSVDDLVEIKMFGRRR